MSLAIRQAILQAKSDREDALHRLAVGEDSKRLRDFLASAENRILRFEKQLKDEQAKIKQRVATEEKATTKKNRDSKPREGRSSLPEDLELSCTDCSSGFLFSGKDQLFFQKNGWSQPLRCNDCRDVKKNTKPPGTNIKCCDCQNEFFFSEAKASIFEEKGWIPPKRCRECSQKQKSQGLARVRAQVSQPNPDTV